jgi:hypothetical protein
MDEPLFTLDRPHFVDLAVSEDGQWTTVLTTLGIDVYDRVGQLVEHHTDRYEQISTYNPKRPMIRIHGSELGHYDQHGTLRIWSLPGLEELEAYHLPRQDNVHRFIFNERWIIYSTIMAHTPPKVWYRSPDTSIPWELETETFPEFVTGNTIFIPDTLPVLFDLVKDETLRELPPDAQVSSDLRYYLVTGVQMGAALYELEDDAQVQDFSIGTETCFCPDNQHLMTRFGDGSNVLYNLASGDAVAEYTFAKAQKGFSELSTVSMTRFEFDRWVRQYDLFNGERLHDIAYLPGMPTELAVSGRYLALLNARKLVIFDLNSAKIIWEKDTIRRGQRPIQGTFLSGTRVVVQSADHFEVWDFVKEEFIAKCRGIAQDVHLAPPDLYYTIANGFRPPKLIRFDIENQAVVAQRDLDERSQRLRFSRHYGPIINVSGYKEFLILDSQTLLNNRTIEGRSFPISFRSKTFFQVCDEVLVMGTQSETSIRSLETGDTLYDIDIEQDNIVICCNNDVSLLVSADIQEQKELHFWRPRESMEPVYRITTRSPVFKAIIADERTFVTVHLDGTVNFWDITHITQRLV